MDKIAKLGSQLERKQGEYALVQQLISKHQSNVKYEDEAQAVLNQTNLDDIIGRECRDMRSRIE